MFGSVDIHPRWSHDNNCVVVTIAVLYPLPCRVQVKKLYHFLDLLCLKSFEMGFPDI